MHTFVDYTKKKIKKNKLKVIFFWINKTESESLWIYENGQNLQIQTWPELNKCVTSSNIMKIANK